LSSKDGRFLWDCRFVDVFTQTEDQKPDRFEAKFGEPYKPLSCTAEALERFASATFPDWKLRNWWNALFQILRCQRRYEPIAVIDNLRPHLTLRPFQLHPVVVRGAAGYPRSIKGVALLRAEDHRMDIAAWLRGLGLEQYATAFRDNAVDGEVLRELTADDLKDLGVTLVGHRRKLLSAITALGQEPSTVAQPATSRATAPISFRQSMPNVVS
jgi:hypothetical protein